MQIFALDSNGQIVAASHATKQKDYACMECSQKVRVRGGTHRNAHFYHLSSSHTCRLNGKSHVHLQVQHFLHQRLPDGQCSLEVRFPEINRVADVVWHAEKLIFEIQCSPISIQEVRNRNSDYQSIGYQVVWLLHDHRYNKKRLSSVESEMGNIQHYFTNINKTGEGMLYDQFAWIERGIRRYMLEPIEIDCGKVMRSNGKRSVSVAIESRQKYWPVYFQGDLIDLALKGDAYVEKVYELERGLRVPLWKRLWQQCIMRPYKLVFNMMLEKACQ